MQAAKEVMLVSTEAYLAQEQGGELRHEFIGGLTYAMAGASEEHNIIAGNLHAALHAHLRGKPCRVFMVDLKVQVRIAQTDIFYYPDLMVVCDARDRERYFKRHPKVLMEVLSKETEDIDRREKFLNYTQIDSLEEYVLVAQNRIEVTVFRRAASWGPSLLDRPAQTLHLASLGFRLPIAAVYEGVRL